MTTYDETVENKTTEEAKVPPKATIRVLSPSYKAGILKEYDLAPVGEKGEILRRKGLFSSQITEWRKIIETETTKSLSQKRGPWAVSSKQRNDLSILLRCNSLRRPIRESGAGARGSPSNDPPEV